MTFILLCEKSCDFGLGRFGGNFIPTISFHLAFIQISQSNEQRRYKCLHITIFLQRRTFYLVRRENAFEWIPFHLWKICNQLIITHRHHPFDRRKSSVFQQRLLSGACNCVIKFYWLWGTIVGMFHGNCRFIHAKKVFKVFANQSQRPTKNKTTTHQVISNCHGEETVEEIKWKTQSNTWGYSGCPELSD